MIVMLPNYMKGELSMAKCKECGRVYAVYGGSKGSKCPKCKSNNIDTSKEGK